MDYDELYKINSKMWEEIPIDMVFTTPLHPSPIKQELEDHIEWLKEQEAKDKNFRCKCKVCLLATWNEEDGMD